MSDKEKQIYYNTLRNMSFEKKALKVFELTEMTRQLMKRGLELQYPEKSKATIQELYLKRLAECHNSNY
ncbi:MAG: hypothetical protein KBF99_13485 [Leptospiraceae bacterium]|nr:hypothetical protein [Leptospiraceae bacterium]MBK7057874.1 hypothetical protein [Leptospiraceae bacterium]MBK9501974.1 hypothetical protein [Leptospiraceae bacterium]MBL0263798.1 hypothetical protein [Leptospiraceae bacterium]MBP9164189.1 hypothetical protein [Leptospiraceae bacterium]